MATESSGAFEIRWVFIDVKICEKNHLWFCFVTSSVKKKHHEFQIINIDFQNVVFDWIDLERILDKWKLSCNKKKPRPKKLRCAPQPSKKMLSRSLNREQFVDACMLAGTEYCLTFPYLQVDQAGCHLETLGVGHLETSHFRKFFLR